VRNPTVIDLFAGCGGMTLGFARAGFRPIFAVEHDRKAAATYERNFGSGHMHTGDIAEVETFPRADVIVGGPPCQGFSLLGGSHGSPEDERNHLWKHYARAVDQAQPKVFVMENVPQLLTSPAYLEFVEHVQSAGYTVESKILRASEYGVPQHRRRAIVIGAKDPDLIAWPTPTHGEGGGLLPWVTVRDALADLPATPDGRNWHTERPSIRETSRIRYSHVPVDGGNRLQMRDSLDASGQGHLVPACWRDRDKAGLDVFGRLWWNRPSVTIRTEFYKPEKGRYLHPQANRPITLREGARLQSFPDDFTWPEDQTMGHVARQIGNAVPPQLAQVIAQGLRESLAKL
jgi:DNA (cytosine-5)-methyltransferase 1